MSKKLAIILIVAILATLCVAGTVSADQGTPAASEIPGVDNQNVARLGNQTGQATQAGPCGPACRRGQGETETTETIDRAALTYAIYMPAVFSSPASTPDFAMPANAY